MVQQPEGLRFYFDEQGNDVSAHYSGLNMEASSPSEGAEVSST